MHGAVSLPFAKTIAIMSCILRVIIPALRRDVRIIIDSVAMMIFAIAAIGGPISCAALLCLAMFIINIISDGAPYISAFVDFGLERASRRGNSFLWLRRLMVL